jgi:Mn2+/Fe2+ NRAMP family transporter
VGAQFGYQLGWTLLFSYPLMAAIQEIAARIGSTTGHGIAANLRKHYPRWLLDAVIVALLIANVINLGADIAAMGDAAAMILPGPMQLWVIVITVCSVAAEAWLSYARYAAVLKWVTLSLLAYVATAIVAHVHWDEAVVGAILPHMSAGAAAATALVAVLGTTISPYLFFWQSSQEVEELHRRHHKALCIIPRVAGPELKRIRVDTLVGMGISNVIGLFVMVAVAATLHTHGIHKIDSSVQAAQALAPIAGRFASVVFAAGIIGTGMLALPVLAGSAGYAVCETFRWNMGLDKKPRAARAFYGVIAGATLLGVLLAFSPISPMKALYWAAVLNGVLAAPLMTVMMLISSNEKIMGRLAISWRMRVAGWTATLVMAAASVGLFMTA